LPVNLSADHTNKTIWHGYLMPCPSAHLADDGHDSQRKIHIGRYYEEVARGYDRTCVWSLCVNYRRPQGKPNSSGKWLGKIFKFMPDL